VNGRLACRINKRNTFRQIVSTAKALGLTILQSIIARVDEVIE
jgi:hypothetical protein